MRILSSLLLAAALLSGAGPAFAELAGPNSNISEFFGVSAGAKGAFGGNYLNEPDEGIPGAELPYESGAGGWGGGGGLYTEFRVLWGFLGLEFDLLFDHAKNWCGIDYNSIVDTEWIYTATSLRMPLLLKGNLEMKAARVGLGIGPEFVIGLKTGTDIQITDGETYTNPADVDLWRSRFHSKKQTDTHLCVNLGIAIKVWKLAITIDLRYSYNLTQPDDYLDRVEYTGPDNATDITTLASHTMDGRFLLGIAYEFWFDY